MAEDRMRQASSGDGDGRSEEEIKGGGDSGAIFGPSHVIRLGFFQGRDPLCIGVFLEFYSLFLLNFRFIAHHTLSIRWQNSSLSTPPTPTVYIYIYDLYCRIVPPTCPTSSPWTSWLFGFLVCLSRGFASTPFPYTGEGISPGVEMIKEVW